MSSIDQIRWIILPSFSDDRGVLTAIESDTVVPFPIKRIFYMYEITENRGGHAHRETEQVAIALAGAFKFKLSDTKASRTFILDKPTRGLYLPPMVFLDEIIQSAPGSICLVLASTSYDDEKYIRSFQKYQEAISSSE